MAAPLPAVGVARLSAGSGVQDVYRARLAQRLAPANAVAPGAEPPFESVVISSAGIQIEDRAPVADIRQASALPPVGGVLAVVPDAAMGAVNRAVWVASIIDPEFNIVSQDPAMIAYWRTMVQEGFVADA